MSYVGGATYKVKMAITNRKEPGALYTGNTVYISLYAIY